MVVLNRVFAILLAIVVATFVNAFRRADGDIDGIYVGLVDKDGHKCTVFAERGNNSVHSNHIGIFPSLHARDTGAHCDGKYMSAEDIGDAVNCLANFFATGNSFYSKMVSCYRGSAVAFGCNYGKGQHYDSKAFYEVQQAVTNKCGSAVGGWYSHESWKSSYGRTQSSSSFC